MTAAAKYRKKPITIEAMGPLTQENCRNIAAWVGERAGWKTTPTPSRVELWIHTLEGQMTANRGDWIIKGVHGEFYPCKPDIFAATYDEVTP